MSIGKRHRLTGADEPSSFRIQLKRSEGKDDCAHCADYDGS
jgi:hypothetical protein